MDKMGGKFGTAFYQCKLSEVANNWLDCGKKYTL